MKQGKHISPPVQPRQRSHLGTWLARGLLLVVFLAGFLLPVLPWGRAAIRALLLLPVLLTAGATPGPLAFLGEPMRHRELTLSSRSGPVLLEVYAPIPSPPPVPGVRGGFLIVPGVGNNRTNPQLVNLAQSLAHLGLVVMVVRTPALINYELSPAESDAVVQAFQVLSRWPGVDADRLGIVCFSAGGALGSLAAGAARIRDRGAFLLLFGSYFDVIPLLRDAGRRAFTVDGQRHPWHPRATSLRVLANTFASTLPPAEGARLTQAFAPGGAPLTADDLAHLSPPAAAAYHLLAGDQPKQGEQNLAALSPPMQTLAQALSPRSVVQAIDMPIYVLHDRHDAFIPFPQSRDFAAALTRLGHPPTLVEFSIFEHVEVQAGQGLGLLLTDVARLFGVLVTLLRISA